MMSLVSMHAGRRLGGCNSFLLPPLLPLLAPSLLFSLPLLPEPPPSAASPSTYLLYVIMSILAATALAIMPLSNTPTCCTKHNNIMALDLPSSDDGMEITLPDSDSGLDLMDDGTIIQEGSTCNKKPAAAAPMKKAAGVKKRPAAKANKSTQKDKEGKEDNDQKKSTQKDKEGKRNVAQTTTYSEFQHEMDLTIGDPEMPQTLKEMIYMTKVEEPTIMDDVIEVFSVPRLVQPCANVGLRIVRSMGILNGWDLRKENVQINCFNEFRARQPRIAVVSPPCTMFSFHPVGAKSWAILHGNRG